MNIPDLLNPTDYEVPTSRRAALRKAGKLGAGLALASLPAAFLIPKMSFAQDGGGLVDILNYALTLEYLEESFYRQGTASGVIEGSDAQAKFELIERHEADHVEYLTDIINDVGGTPVELTDDAFDFTALGVDPFQDYDFFLTLAMGFEDTGVRAYKGQAPNIPRDLMVTIEGTEFNLLTVALQVHSLEARHAAEVRRLRMMRGVNVAPWIILDDNTDGTPLEAIYGAGMPAATFPAEENTVQAGADLTALGYTAIEASASFDEPLDMETVLGIAGPFFADSSS